VLVIGDFTAQVGDPSDKLEKRPFLTAAQVKKNLKSYLAQIGKIIDLKKAEVRYNSEWLKKLNFQEISELAEDVHDSANGGAQKFQRSLGSAQRDQFARIFISIMQGYDSVMVKADVELGGTDQLLIFWQDGRSRSAISKSRRIS
jgi:tyrosyl-tRNA synthetase